MEMIITNMEENERLYAYQQSGQIMGQTGSIGYLRGDFGDGEEFYTTWIDHHSGYNTEEFRSELDKVVNALRTDGSLLCNKREMSKLCQAHPEAGFKGNTGMEYGFKIQTPQHAYMLRCNPNAGDYNFYLYAYVGKFLNRHIEKAKYGIRFITPHYKELFRIPDGDKIRIRRYDGKNSDEVCRFIDEYHVEIGSSRPSLYHICQFAELMERNGNSAIPLRSSLPERCYINLPDTGEIGIVQKGEPGYILSDLSPVYGKDGQQFVDDLNQKEGVTKAQAEAMKAGAMYGWQSPDADPKNYDVQGNLLRPRAKDRGDAR